VIYISVRGLEEHKKHGDKVMQFFSGWEAAKPSKDPVMNHVMILVAKNSVMNPAMIIVVKNHAIRTR